MLILKVKFIYYHIMYKLRYFDFFSNLYPLDLLQLSIVLVKTSSTILNRYGESGHSCLALDFSGFPLSFTTFKLMFMMDLL